MSTHQAYVQAKSAGPLTVEQVPTPSPTSGQVLVDVLATPLLAFTRGVLDGSLGYPLIWPFTPGISAIGRVAATGPDAPRLKPGQLVFCNPSIIARDDPTGGTALLQGWTAGGTPESHHLTEHCWRDGAWAEKMLVPTENAVPLDEDALLRRYGYSLPQLCWLNGLLVPYGGLKAAGLAPGGVVIVAPATGHFGSCAVRVALAMGARTVVAAGRNGVVLEQLVGMHPDGRVVSLALSGVLETDVAGLKAAMPAGVAGADVYIDFSPPQLVDPTHPKACVAALRKGGQAVLMGGVPGDISLNYFSLMMNDITVKGKFMYDVGAPAELHGLLAGGLLRLDDLKTDVFCFEDLEAGIDHAGEHGGAGSLTILSVREE